MININIIKTVIIINIIIIVIIIFTIIIIRILILITFIIILILLIITIIIILIVTIIFIINIIIHSPKVHSSDVKNHQLFRKDKIRILLIDFELSILLFKVENELSPDSNDSYIEKLHNFYTISVVLHRCCHWIYCEG